MWGLFKRRPRQSVSQASENQDWMTLLFLKEAAARREEGDERGAQRMLRLAQKTQTGFEQ